ncbi:Gfo/Idh/MocA family protein [Pantoea deleyi]|uniref:Gfo/Idh/MocA family protein n=1 Tax=Pantoea deleyi TaxID=470932 RepID=UPI0035D48CFD
MVRLGIIGTGMMADIIAQCCVQAGIKLHSVLSRSDTSAREFCRKHRIPEDKAYSSRESFFSDTSLDAVYIATPTSEKESLFNLCIQYKKHSLIEKPLPFTLSMNLLLQEARKNGIVWLDAAHYIHTAWYRRIDELLTEYVGRVNRIQASFFWPDKNSGQIKFNPSLEPYGVMGDLGWYPLRLISKFVHSKHLRSLCSLLSRDDNRAIVSMDITGLTDNGIIFAGQASYRDAVVQQRCEISGDKGRITIHDFVMPYSGSFVYGTLLPCLEVEIESGMKPLLDKKTQVFEIEEKQHISMLKNLTQFIHNPQSVDLATLQGECIETMKLMQTIAENPELAG